MKTPEDSSVGLTAHTRYEGRARKSMDSIILGSSCKANSRIENGQIIGSKFNHEDNK